MFVSEVEFMLHKKQLNRVIKIQELKLKLLEKEIKINKIDTRIQLTAMAAILKPSEMSDTDFVLKINEKMSELLSEEALIRQGAKINQELLEIQKTLDEIENREICKMAGIEKYYEITEVYAWQWEGNTNITIEDIPEEIRNEVTMLKVERSIKTSFTEESNQLFLNYKGYQYNLFPGDFLIFEYNEFIDGFHFICVERGKDSLKKYKKCNSILFLPTSKALDSLNPKDAIGANAINFFNESCQALGILVDLNKKRLATCKKCGKTNKECFPTTIEEYDMYIEMLCENCLTEILDKKITAIKPKKIE